MFSLYPNIYNLYGNSPKFQKTKLNKKEVKLIENLLNPKIDYVFKRIFGHIGNEEITKSFIEAITKEKLTDIKLDCNPITEKNLFDDKIVSAPDITLSLPAKIDIGVVSTPLSFSSSSPHEMKPALNIVTNVTPNR